MDTDLIPKFCTSIEMSLLNNGNIALALMYSENDGESPGIFQHITVDKRRAISIRNALDRLIRDGGCGNGKTW